MSEHHKITLDSPEILDRITEYEGLTAERRAQVREDLLQCYPQLQDELRRCLDGLDLLDGVADLGANRDHTEALKEELGDFEIIREIGRGAMGTVYEARQRSLGRMVALKVLPFAAFLDQNRLQRFKQEAQAAARLRHPNIVNVFCVGCERGVHFYAMELIKGVSLADVIRELQRSPDPQQRPADDPSRDPSVDPALDPFRETQTLAELSTQRSIDHTIYFRRVAALGAVLADALNYAHQQGVIHRDIKPSNIMLDDRGTPWVTDFGLAQIQDDCSLTMTGDLLGTLRYMSPEQADGRKLLDGRTDIYSLAATLYELLTLRPANPGKDRRELLKRLEESRPVPPRQIDARIPIDLETILLQAMQPRAENRYGTAHDFAEDLRRYLATRPIQARRTSPLHHGLRYLQRHPYSSSLCVTLLLLLLSLSIAGPLLAWQFRQLAQEAKLASTKARLTTEAVLNVLDSHTDTTFLAIENSPSNEVINVQLIADSLAHYEKLLTIEPDNPKLQATVGHAYNRLAFAAGQFDLVDSDDVDSRQMGVRAAELFESLLAQEPDNIEYALKLAESYSRQATWVKDKKNARGVELNERAVALLRPFVQNHPENHKLREALSVSIELKAWHLQFAGRTEEAEAAHMESLALARNNYLTKPNAENRVWLAWVLQQLASLRCHRQDRVSEAIELWREAIALYAGGYESTQIATRWRLGEFTTRGWLAAALLRSGQYEEAETILNNVLERLVLMCQQYPEFSWPLQVAQSAMLTRGNLLLAQGRPETAKRIIDQYDYLFLKNYHLKYASNDHLHHLRARVAWLLGDRSAATAHYAKALAGELPPKLEATVLVLSFDASLHDGERALDVAPEDSVWLRIAALSRVERDLEAMQLADGQTDVNAAAFFLAMSCHRLGQFDQARQYYDLGSRQLQGKSIDAINLWRPEFIALQAEAEHLLGLDKDHPHKKNGG